MAHFLYHFAFTEDVSNPIKGCVDLAELLPFICPSPEKGIYRPGKITLEGSGDLDIVLYHSDAIAKFMYMRTSQVDANLMDIIGLSTAEIAGLTNLSLPGQLCLGSERAKISGQAIMDVLASPALRSTISNHKQQNLAVFPIAREGLKYQVAEAIFENYGFYCDEVVLDAHHVFDSSVPVYNRKVEMTLFKDKDLDKLQRENVRVAFLADSIASGLVLTEVIAKVKERFAHIERVEVIAPLATVRGLCRIAQCEVSKDVSVRVHVFETLLNALPPDYYYSAHFNIPEFHMQPDLEQAYRRWWGEDSHGHAIADTACAGYGWSEAFYSPRKQIQMMNSQLEIRHHLTIADIVRRNL